MISAPGTKPRLEHLPFSGRIENKDTVHPIYTLSRLARKLTLIDDHKLIMWADNSVVAYGIIKRIRERRESIVDLGSAIQHELDEYNEAEKESIAMNGLSL